MREQARSQPREAVVREIMSIRSQARFKPVLVGGLYPLQGVRSRSQGTWAAWKDALTHLWKPIFASMLIVASGFSLFLLSAFPPTQRLGVLVCAGAILTDLVVLLVLPAIIGWRDRGERVANS